MRKLVSALTIFVGASLAAGCKHPGSAKLEGRWRGVRAEGVSQAVQEAANSFALQTEITARGNTITVSLPGGKAQQAVYVVDDENKVAVMIHTDRDGVLNKETFAFTDDGKAMTWRLGDGRFIWFQRLPE